MLSEILLTSHYHMQKVNIRVREREKGNFEARVVINGKRYSRYGNSISEAKKKAKILLEESEKSNVLSKAIKLNIAMQDYLENVKQARIKASTYDRVESTFRYHIQDEAIGRMQVGVIKSSDIEKHLNMKCQAGLSKSAVKKIFNLLGEFFRYAVAIREIIYNPMDLVEMPHSSKFIHESKEMELMTVDELKKVIAIAEKIDENGKPKFRYGEAIILLINTGLRSGELRGIKKQDIDFDRKILHIRRNVTYAKDRENGGIIYLIGDLKTENSKRNIPLNNRALLAIQRLLETTYNPDTDYLVCAPVGEIVSNSPLQKCYTAILKEADIKKMGLHSTRHTFATVILKDAEDKGQIKEVSELLGHSQVSTTYKYYIKTSNEDKRNLVDQLNLLV